MIQKRKKWNDKASMALNVRTIVMIIMVFFLITVAYAALTMPKWEKDKFSAGSGEPLDPNLPDSKSSEVTIVYADETPNIHGQSPYIYMITADGQNLTGQGIYQNGTLVEYAFDTDNDGTLDMGLIPSDGNSYNTDPGNWETDANLNGIPDNSDPAFTYTTIGVKMSATIYLQTLETDSTGGGGVPGGGNTGGGGGGAEPSPEPVPTTITYSQGYISNDKGKVYASLSDGQYSFVKDKQSVADAWLRLWGGATVDKQHDIPVFVQFIIKDGAGHVYYNNQEEWVTMDYSTDGHKSVTIDSLPFPVVNNTQYTLMFSAYLGIPGHAPDGQTITTGLGSWEESNTAVDTALIGTYEVEFTYNPNGGA